MQLGSYQYKHVANRVQKDIVFKRNVTLYVCITGCQAKRIKLFFQSRYKDFITTNIKLIMRMYRIESVDSVSRDGPDKPIIILCK